MNLYQKKNNKKEQQPNERICVQVRHKTPLQPSPPRLEQRTNRQALLTPAIIRPSVSEQEEEKNNTKTIFITGLRGNLLLDWSEKSGEEQLCNHYSQHKDKLIKKNL